MSAEAEEVRLPAGMSAPLPYAEVQHITPRRTAVHTRARRSGPKDRLPDDVITWIRTQRGSEPRTRPGLTELELQARLPLDHYLHDLWVAGWPMHSLMAAYGTGRQAIHNRMYRARRVPLPAGVQLPPVPARETGCGPDHMVGDNFIPGTAKWANRCRACKLAAATPRPQIPPIPDAACARLRELGAQARRVTGVTPAAHPDRVASLALRALILELKASGHTYRQVAVVLELTEAAVSERMRRPAVQFAPAPGVEP